MTFHFHSSEHPTIGIEIELQLLAMDTLDLIPKSEEILNLCKTNGIERVKAEIHQSMIEVDSEISKNVKECKGFLKKRLQRLYEVSESIGIKLGVTGTHPFQKWSERLISNQDRYLNLHEKFQWLTRRMNIYGLHVHVGVSSGERALAISNALLPYLPHLLAISANSPFWQGIDTGMQSSRISILDSFPYSGVPKAFQNWNDFEGYYNTLRNVGVIGSLKDLYWHIRPNLGFGTVEFRICDGMSSLTETIAVAALIHCMVVWADEKIKSGSIEMLQPRYHWIVPDNLWTAARDGLEAKIIENLDGDKKPISQALLELIAILEPTAHKLNCIEELCQLKEMIYLGNGAQHQRAVYQTTQSLKSVVDWGVKKWEQCITG